MCTLADLIRELLNDPPRNECADDGTTCPFCAAEYNYTRHHCGGTLVDHAPDCWINRAGAALAVPTTVYECSEWNWYDWEHFATCATIDGARDSWRERMKGVTFAGDPIEVFRDGMKVGAISASSLRP